MLIASGLVLPLGSSDSEIVDSAVKKSGVAKQNIKEAGVRRISYDARHGEVNLVCSVSLRLANASLEKSVADKKKGQFVYVSDAAEKQKIGSKKLSAPPVVVGYGPAGIFAAYILALNGYNPVVIEQGASIEQRTAIVDKFFTSGMLDRSSNIQFGEGGAGTFSDGKLTTRINDPLCDFVLETFVKFGAPRELLIEAKPHIGTDILRDVIRNIRNETIRLGAKINFNTKLESINVQNGAVKSVTAGGSRIPADAVILACGHSAREVFTMVKGIGASVVPKPFSVGFRIEHLQSDVDRSRWGKMAGDPRLPAADYSLSEHIGSHGVYTFCMCPGGTVVAGASDRGQVVTNGMSNRARAGKNANAAVAVSVDTSTFGTDAFAGVEFQKRLESAAFTAGGSNYCAPASDVGSFLDGRSGLRTDYVEPTYPLGVVEHNLENIIGKQLADCIRAGLRSFANKVSCFGNAGAVLTGIESRTSSPVRILRRDNRQAENVDGLYPCGEGAGYAGGIMSSATDGINTAKVIISEYRPISI